MMNFDPGFTRLPKEWAWGEESEEKGKRVGGGMVKKKKKLGTHKRIYSRSCTKRLWGMTSELGNVCVRDRDRKREREGKTMCAHCFTWGVNRGDVYTHTSKYHKQMKSRQGSWVKVSIKSQPSSGGKDVFLEELITQHPPNTHTQTHTQRDNSTGLDSIWMLPSTVQPICPKSPHSVLRASRQQRRVREGGRVRMGVLGWVGLCK